MSSTCRQDGLWEPHASTPRAGSPYRSKEAEYTQAIAASGRQSKWKEATRLLEELGQTLVQANVIAYTAAINACAKGNKWQHAIVLLREAQERRGEGDVIMYSAVISACEKGAEWRHGLNLLGEMQDNSVVANVITYSATISACEKSGEWQQALSLLEEMHRKRLPPNLITYNAAISACEKGMEWRRALAFLGQVDADSLEKDVITYSTAISACEKVGEWQQAFALLREMQQCSVEANIITCSSAISACEKGGAWQQALVVLKEVGDCNMHADLVTYNAAISACESGRQWQCALALVGEMTKIRLMANRVTYSAAISACEKSLQWDAALKLLSSMEDARVERDTLVYYATSNACVACGRWGVALDLMSAMLEEGVEERSIATLGFEAYEHQVQAGGPIDCFKHVVLALLLDHMVKDSAPFTYVDTHAGSGIYDFRAQEGLDARTFQDGFPRMIEDPYDGRVPQIIAQYIGLQRRFNSAVAAESSCSYYLGSPALARQWLRPQDQAVLFERSPQIFDNLRKAMLVLGELHGAAAATVETFQDDSYKWIATAPAHKFGGRGLVLIDPPYKPYNDYVTWNLFTLRHLSQLWPSSCLAVWYPCLASPEDQVALLHRRVSELHLGEVLVAEMAVERSRWGCLARSGVLLVRPPPEAEALLREVLPILGRMLAHGSDNGVETSVFWLADGIA